MSPAETFAAAMRHHQAGQLAEAERLYGEVLTAEPGNLQALVLCGALAHMAGRNGKAVDLFGRALALGEDPNLYYNIGLAKWALGERAEATAYWKRAIDLHPNFAQAHMNLGNALREDGRIEEALPHLRQALQLAPSPFAHNNLGLALAGRGDPQAVMHFRRATEMDPAYPEPYLNLALELAAQGDIEQALGLVQRSLQIKESPAGKALFVWLAPKLDVFTEDAGLRALVTRAATEGWERANDLASLATTLIKHDPRIDDPLLHWLLDAGPICDLTLEAFLTASRATLLESAERAPDAWQDEQLTFACALARQCYINEHAYAASDDELVRAGRLRDMVTAAGAAAQHAQIAAVAAYFPLHTLAAADALLAGSWPQPLIALIDQQIREPRIDAECRGAIPPLTPIEDVVSRRVQEQYEQNPYPRWVAPESRTKYESIDALMKQERPHAPYRALNKRELDVLIAGCGTGRHSIGVAQQLEHAKLLAIDLSSASLGYAKARTNALGVSNIEYAHADILALGSLGRTFDMIQSVGVLHHLADSWAGWRVLTSLLRPGGVMFIGLYSERARRDVVAAREFIATRGYGSTADDIRRARQDLMTQGDEALRNVALFNDFFTLSECRDLLFHVQEHRMTLPQIKDFLAANGLTLLGFEVDFRTAQKYAARFPADKAMTDLECWDQFEQDHPYTFASMYRFWAQKAA